MMEKAKLEGDQLYSQEANESAINLQNVEFAGAKKPQNATSSFPPPKRPMKINLNSSTSEKNARQKPVAQPISSGLKRTSESIVSMLEQEKKHKRPRTALVSFFY